MRDRMTERQERLKEQLLQEEEVHEEMFRNNLYKEETAAELSPYTRPLRTLGEFDAERRETPSASGLGITALILSILSLLFMPITFGLAGVIMGIFSYVRGSKGLGLWAVGLGAITLINQFFLVPLLY